MGEFFPLLCWKPAAETETIRYLYRCCSGFVSFRHEVPRGALLNLTGMNSLAR